MSRRSSWPQIPPRGARRKREASWGPPVARGVCSGDSYFCRVCQDTFKLRRPIVEHEGYRVKLRHHQDLDSFGKAAQAGCWFCERLWHRWATLRPDKEADYPPLLAELRAHRGGKEVYAEFKCGSLVLGVKFTMLSVRADDRIVSIPGGPQSTFSDRSFAQAQRWIEDCKSNHPLCNPKRSVAWHPTRLLDLRSTTGQVRLIETGVSHVADDDPYVTLSHRWPSNFDSSLILRDGTYQPLLDGVAISDLPKLVQDAAAICSRFSIRYLWVDCMCIEQYQLNQEDWCTQSLSMEDVYSHSYINLSAVASTSTHSSLFKSRLTDQREGQLTARLNMDNDDHRGHLRRGSEEVYYQIIDGFLWKGEVDNAPLNNRAWVLQERLLASRTLHFGSDQLFWECRREVAAEAYPNGFPFHVLCYHGFKNRLEPDADPQINQQRILDQHSIWSRIAEYYSKCGLTNRSDKLIALSGLAKRAKKLFQDEYIAGVWRRTLERDLFWYTDDVLLRKGESGNATRTKSYRAPSFAWTSIDAGILMPFERESDRVVLEVQGVRLTHDSTDEFGAVTGGFVDLRCILQKVFFHKTHDLRRHVLRINGKDAIENAWSNEPVPEYSCIYLDDYPKYFDPRGKDDLYCVPDAQGNAIVYHLLLQLVDAVQGIFKRFGVARTVFIGPYQTEEIDRLLHNYPAEAANYPCRHYDAEKKRHIIRII